MGYLLVLEFLAGFVVLAALYVLGDVVILGRRRKGRDRGAAIPEARKATQTLGGAAELLHPAPRSSQSLKRVVVIAACGCAIALVGFSWSALSSAKQENEDLSQFSLRVATQIANTQKSLALASEHQSEIEIRSFHVLKVQQDLLLKPLQMRSVTTFDLEYLGGSNRFAVPYAGHYKKTPLADVFLRMAGVDTFTAVKTRIAPKVWDGDDVTIQSVDLPRGLKPGDRVTLRFAEAGEKSVGEAPFAISAFRPDTYVTGIDSLIMRLYFQRPLRGYWIPEYSVDQGLHLLGMDRNGNYNLDRREIQSSAIGVDWDPRFFTDDATIYEYSLRVQLGKEAKPLAIIFWQAESRTLEL